MKRDMLTGKPAREILLFALPMLLGNIFQQLYNVVDSVVVGRCLGENALAAVGGAFPIMFILNAVAMGLTIGASILLSQLYGAGREEAFQKTLYTTILTMAVLTVVLTAAGQVLIHPLLRLMGTPPSTFSDSALYLRIIFGGIVFTFSYNTSSALFRAIGDSKTPLYFLITASVLNIALDLFLVVVCNMGVAGAAVATVVSQGLSFLLSLLYIIIKVPLLRLRREHCVFDPKLLRSVLRFGVPTMLQQVSVSLSVMCVQGMVNQFGAKVMAGYAVAGKIESLAMMPMFNISSALSTFAAQNIGAGSEARAREGLRVTALLAAAICGGLALIIYLVRVPLIALFVKSGADPLVFTFGSGYLGVVCAFYIVNALYNTLGGMLRGVGDTGVNMAVAVLSLVVRVAASLLLARYTALGFAAIWWGLPISWGVGLLLCVLRYLSGGWRAGTAVEAS